MSSDHFVKRCQHGTLVTQCRCATKDKRVIIVPCPGHCKASQAEMRTEITFDSVSPETHEYEWPLVGERLKMWGQDA